MHEHAHQHGHDHGHHHHGHAHVHGSGRALKWSLIATLLFVAVQAAGGWTSGSLALLSDAGHNLTDAVALGLAAFGVYLRRKPADQNRTYGYGRGGVLAAFVNALLLIGLSLYLFAESWHRLVDPQDVEEQTMLIVAALGIVLNLAIMYALHRHNSDVNIRAAWVHMLGDALGSVAIIVGALVMRSTGWHLIDPLLSILIAGLIVWTAWGIMRETLNVLLEGMPQGLELDAVVSGMRAVRGVVDVPDVHIWTLGSGEHALSCHAQIADVPPSESACILRDLNQLLADQFSIRHTTIQFEHAPCPVVVNGCNLERCSS